jgi:glyoxylase-like metal-dependent hydrolase (beta-lactamase superfamily II)
VTAAAEPARSHPDILRVVAPNPGPMTLAGTNSYVVGEGPAWVIDPGPVDEGHLSALRAAAGERGGIAGVLLTHSHADHSQAAELLDAPLLWGRVSTADEVGQDGPEASSPGRPPERIGPFEAIPTPGHARDHVAFAYGGVCFCGDLVLGEGSSIVLPNGGGLGAYMDSLETLRERSFDLLCPGHGPWITDPAARLAEYREHRLDRERRLLEAIEGGATSRTELLAAAWGDVPEPLRPMAALAMEAHLDKLGAEGRLPAELGP